MSPALALELLVSMLLRRLRLIIGLCVLFGGLAAVLILSAPPRYVAQSSVLAKFGREHTLQRYDEGAGLVPGNYGQAEIVNSVVEIMRADGIVAQVVTEMGPDRLYDDLDVVSPLQALLAMLVPDDETPAPANAPPQATDPGRVATDRLRGSLSVTQAGNSNVIDLRLTHADPVIAAEALNRFVAVARRTYRDLYIDDLVPMEEAEVTRVREEVRQARKTVADFEEQTITFAQDGEMDRLLVRKSTLEQQRASLETCCAQSAAAQDITREITRLNAQVLRLNADRSELRELLRIRERTEEQLEDAERRLGDSRRLDSIEDGDLSSVQVISPALPPTTTVRPGRLVRLILAGIFVLIGSGAVALALELLARRFSTSAQLQAAFGLPVLADVARMRRGSGRR